jgi:hypothetical protein
MNGFSATVIADLMSLGLDSTDFTLILQQLEMLDPALLAGTYPEQFNVFAAQLSSGAAVPEPSTLIVLASAILILCLALVVRPGQRRGRPLPEITNGMNPKAA